MPPASRSLLRPFLLICAAQAAFLTLGHAQEEYMKNPGFEGGTLEPWEWYVAGDAQAKGEVDTHEKHSGQASYRIHNESRLEPNVYGQLRQYVNGLRANTTYRLTAWVKGKNVTGAQIALGPEWKILQPLPNDNFDWTEVEKEFTTGDSPEKYDVVFISGSTTEALWIDDVKIEEAGGKPGASLFEPALWPGLPASAAFYPVFPADRGEAPVVSLRSSGSPAFGADIQMSHGPNSLFF